MQCPKRLGNCSGFKCAIIAKRIEIVSETAAHNIAIHNTIDDHVGHMNPLGSVLSSQCLSQVTKPSFCDSEVSKVRFASH